MHKYIYTNNGSKEQSGSEYYGIKDTEDLIDKEGNCVILTDVPNNKVLAYKTKRADGTHKYMIKINYEKKLFNPLSIYGKDKTYNLLGNTTRSNLVYKEVNSIVFDFYLKFLSSKNIAWLNKAERAV